MIDCGVAGACDYQTSSAENMPLVTSVTKLDASTLQFVGTGFQLLTDFAPRVSYLGIEASEVSVGLDTTVTATFPNGVPISGVAQKALLYYVQASTGVQHHAQNINFVNAASVSALDSDVSCSFAGGCTIVVSQEGLLANLLSNPAKNTLRICGQLGKPDLMASTVSQVRFTVPALPTAASVEQFNII